VPPQPACADTDDQIGDVARTSGSSSRDRAISVRARHVGGHGELEDRHPATPVSRRAIVGGCGCGVAVSLTETAS
jgi:hypothetical protein